ncbi:MAG TPA: hypothetical protein PLH75_03755 [Amaricoccus sp.]|uniref:hypothetical protein n=1 Tax=Amaricoccus sp. TaxID=1872485 RepID=UPI001E013442|nr:hypothetical protein [Amaricoccus sp.]MCC0067268.1 hypothetical protein [Rhodovulum sp.]HPG21888.1 hypothetical protein [Amaricoccus sp.]HRW14933.1 hypothetical protein [Amaricoccus sp.]
MQRVFPFAVFKFALAAALLFLTVQSAPAEITKKAYIELWTRTCKMGATTHNISLPANELAIVKADLDNMHFLESVWYANYETKKGFGMKLPAYPSWIEKKCRCAAEFIAPRKNKLGGPTSADLVSKVSEQCMAD